MKQTDLSETHEVKCTVDGLKAGMYVSRLDRPWIETSFPMAGLMITGESDIQELKKFCEFVYVDVEVGLAPEPEHHAPLISKFRSPRDARENTGSSDPDKRQKHQQQKDRYAGLRKNTYEIKTSFQEELPKARGVHENLQTQAQRIISDLENGHKLDIDSLKNHVGETVESIIRNPSALMLLTQLEKSDEYTYNHALGVSVWCAEFGRHLGLEQSAIEELALGGMLLDVGKIKLPKDLFSKKLFFDPDRKLIRTHVQLGIDLLVTMPGIAPAVIDMIATHHEREDGSGYPRQLTAEQIPLYGRIAGLVDSYDAMTTKRPYTDKVLSPNQAVSEIYNWRDRLFEHELIEQFIQTIGIYPAGSLVELNTGEVGMVVSINMQKKLCPKIFLLLDPDKKSIPNLKYMDLAASKDRTVVKGLSSGAYGIRFDEIEVENIKNF